ncbi:MAG: DNA translocase FtsK, partial [Oscillospiraceae bacterium]|nr:DNA translocase FtsK [Oscillospiraceae bacterium]
MATTRKKTTSNARSGTKTGGSRSGTASRSRASAKNAKRPIRREVGGMVMLLLALIVLVSYFTGDGWLINLIPRACKGLFGVGYYLMVPALMAAAWVLIGHRGRPVALRTACALLTPYLFGGVCHMLFCKLDLSDAAKLFPTLWETGFTLESGGVLSGGTAHGFMAVLGKPASVIVFLVLLLALLMVVAQVTPAMLIELWREREDYDEEDYPEPPPRRQPQPKPKRAPKQTAQAPVIDIPLDGTPLG